jgi:hypothetical protein
VGSKVPAEVGDRPLSHRETWKVIATGNHCLVAAADEFFVSTSRRPAPRS